LYFILGLGISGKAVVDYFLEKGETVLGFDDRKEVCEKVLSDCKNLILQETLEGVTRMVISPGISKNHPLVKEAKKQQIEVIGEVELALEQGVPFCLGVTGTNGKTTVTEMIAFALKELKYPVYLLGNGGVPVISFVGKMEKEAIVVLELSSFQLETMKTKGLDAACILNITEDHIDWHGSFEAYREAKWKIASLLKSPSKLLVNHNLGSHSYPTFKVDKEFCDIGGDLLPLSFFDGVLGHDLENLLAALWMLKQVGVSFEEGKTVLKRYKKAEHRIEFVRKIAEVSYYNDSKGTNTDATLRAVESFQQPIWLIAGGVDKGLDFSFWKKPFEGRVKGVLLIGQAAQTIEKELQGFLTKRCVSLEEAVETAAQLASSGEIVLLSPGCSSFDQFSSYADRGDRFKKAVMRL
jgi:UDP-N-acetylmuramoylalanine--D-glutamate ligase